MLQPLVAKRVRIVGFDVDGVMTNGTVYVGTAGGEPVELKGFHLQDNIGVGLLRRAGIKVVLISGRVSAATDIRAAALGVDEVVQDAQGRKLPAFEAILERMDLRMENAAFVGDDLADLPVLRRVGLPVAVANASREVREVAQYTTEAPGGRGAVREFAEAVLRARGQWDEVMNGYLKERGEIAPRTSNVR